MSDEPDQPTFPAGNPAAPGSPPASLPPAGHPAEPPSDQPGAHRPEPEAAHAPAPDSAHPADPSHGSVSSPPPPSAGTPSDPADLPPVRPAAAGTRQDPGSRPSDPTSPRAGVGSGRRTPPAGTPSGEARARAAGPSPLAAIALFLVVLEGVALGALWAHPRLPPDTQNRLDRLGADVNEARAQAAAADDAVAALRHGLAAQQTALDSARHALDDLAARVRTPAPTTSQAAAPATATDADLQALRDGLAAARDESRLAVASLASLERSDIAAVRTASTAAIDGFATRLQVMGTRLDQQAAAGDRARLTADRAERLARLEAAAIALADGRPLGAIPNAPPAVLLFADHSPPTLASLVLSFPTAGRHALRASEPQTRGLGFFRRLWTRAEAAVTVREGNRVIVGDPAAGIIAGAQERLEAGDLAGAVSTLGELNGPAADAIDPWRSLAASLVDARAGLADMMAHS